VENSVISSSCEGFGQKPLRLRKGARGPNVAPFLVKSDGLGETIRTTGRPRPWIEKKELTSWR
jgi:hypothetical protein